MFVHSRYTIGAFLSAQASKKEDCLDYVVLRDFRIVALQGIFALNKGALGFQGTLNPSTQEYNLITQD